jgi:hypothetical protein
MAFLVEDLLTSAKMRSFAPISQSTFQDSDLLTIAYEELCLKLVSDIMSAREDFFLTTKLVPLVSGVSHYTIPKMAIGNALKVLIFQDSGGSETVLQHIDHEDRVTYAGMSGSPSRFYFEGDEVVICPAPAQSTGNLVFSYFRKPNQLVATTSAAKITAISSALGSTTFTVNTDLTSTLSVGSLVDFLSAQSPYLLWSDTVAITAITSTTIVVATADIVNAASVVEPVVGDYICENGKANIAQIPDELYPVLCQMTAVRMLAGLGDLNKWNAAKAELAEMRKEALKLIKNRSEASPRRVRGNGFVKAFRF